MDGSLDVRTVEVVAWATSRRWVTKLRPEVWAIVCKVVDIEARICLKSIANYFAPKTASGGSRAWGSRNWSRRRKSGCVLGVVACVAAGICSCLEAGRYSVVQAEDT